MKSSVFRIAASLSPMLAAMFLLTPAHAAPPFSVGTPTPNSTFVNAQTVFSASYVNGAQSVDHCRLFHNGVNKGAMTVSGGVASKSYSFAGPGTATIRVTCYNADESTIVSGETSVSVFADSSPPGIGPFSFSPSSPVSGSPTTISANYDDTDFGSGMNSCHLIVNSAVVAIMNFSGGVGSTAGTVSANYTFPSGGSYAVEMQCTDRSGNLVNRSESVGVTEAVDTTPPSVGSLSHGTPTIGSPVTFSSSVSDDTSIDVCYLYVDGVTAGAMSVVGGTASLDHTFSTAGSYGVYAKCYDPAGNSNSSATASVTVSAPTTSDTTPPVVSAINPSSATAGSAVNVTASFTDAVGVSSCTLSVNDAVVGTMERSGTTAGTTSRSHTFSSAGVYTLRVSCSDAAGNSSSATSAISVGSGSGTGSSPYANRLVKLTCPAGAVDVNHPCKAVYYVGSDGKRHAFPNERVYFTWYSNFDGVIDLTSTQLSGITLGSNVNYRPGMRMVKFTTVNKVYAVGRYGTLRWVTTEAVATAMYGSDWNRKIDDLSDAFFTDYTFGADISSASSFNPTVEAATASNIDANLR